MDIVFNKKQTSDLLTKGYTNTYAHAQGTVSGIAFAKGSASAGSSDDKQKTDWIETLTSRTQRVSTTFENAGKRLLAATNNFRLAITHYDISIRAQRQLISQYTQATAKYQEQADKVGLSADLVAKVKNGSIDISEYDDNTQKKISEYQQWYEKTLSCADAIEQARTQVHELNQEKLDAVTSSFENLRNVITSTRTLIEDQGALFEAFNGYGDNINIEQQKDYLEKEMTNYRQEAAALQETLNSLTDENGKPLSGMDQEVLTTKAQIQDCNSKILEAAASIKKLNDTRIDNITNQFKSLSDLIDSLTGKLDARMTLEKTMNGYVSGDTYDKHIDSLDQAYANTVNTQAEVDLEYDKQQRELSQMDRDALQSQVNSKRSELTSLTKERDKVQTQINEQNKQAQAAQQKTAANNNSYTTRGNYNMRDSANGKIVGTIPRGTTVQGTGQTSNGWTQVTYNGKTGYVIDRGLARVAAPATVAAKAATTVKAAPTVRESADDIVSVKQSALDKVSESVSDAVVVGANVGAQAAQQAVSYQTTGSYNIRQTAGGKRLGTIAKGTTVTATGKKNGNWTEVKWNNNGKEVTGYVSNKGLKQITVGQQQANTKGITATQKHQDALSKQLTDYNNQITNKQKEVTDAQENLNNFDVGFNVNGADAKKRLANLRQTARNNTATTLYNNRNSYFEDYGGKITRFMDEYNTKSAGNNAVLSFIDKVKSFTTANGESASQYLPLYQKYYGANSTLASTYFDKTLGELRSQAKAGKLTEANKSAGIEQLMNLAGTMADATINVAQETKSAEEEAEEHLSKVEQHYSALISLVDSYISYLQAENELINKQTGYDDRQMLVSQVAEQEKKQKELNVAIAAEEAEMKNLKEGSTDWLNAAANVQNYKTQIVQSKSAIEDLKKSLRTLDWRFFDQGVAKNKHLMNEVDSTISLLSSLNDFDYQSPNLTASGVTTLNMNAQGLIDSRKLVDDYTQAIDQLNKEYAKGTINEKTYTEEMQDNVEKRYDAISSVNKYRQAVLTLVKDGIEQETTAMQELINKRTDALSRLKTAHDYEKQIAKSNQNIARIRSQINMLGGDDSQQANQRRRTLQNQLKNAQDDLQDQREQQRYNTVTQAYNDELTAFQEMQKKKEYALNDSVEAQNAAISDALAKTTAQYQTTVNTLSSLFQTYGVQASADLTTPWQNAQTAAQEFADAVPLNGVLKDIELFRNEAAEPLTNPWDAGIKAAETFQESVSSTVSAANAQLDSLMQKVMAAIEEVQALSTAGIPDVEGDASKTASSTVNRYYNPKTGQHLNTTSEKEKANLRNTGWKEDAVKWKQSSDKNAVPVYRVHNPNNGDYLYTTSQGEAKSAVSKGWKDEGISQYANSSNKGTAIYRLYNQKTGMHFFTSSVGEKNTREKQGWKNEGIAYYSGYAGGTYKASKGTHLTDEKGLGSEVIITKNGALRQLDSGDRVFNDEQVKALWAMSKVPAAKFTPVHSSIPEATGKPITVTNNYGSLLTVNGNVDQETLPSLEEILKKASEQTRKDMVDSFRKYGINR